MIFVGRNVGAIDLWRDTDAYLSRIPITDTEVAAATELRAPVRRGQMLTAWQPAMMLNLLDPPAFTPEHSAAKANRISQRLYAELLVTSGYAQLVQQVGLLRFLSTEPDRSETVKLGKTIYSSDSQGSQEVKVTGEEIRFSAPVTSDAHREVQHFRARTLLSTQPRGRQRPVQYRIWLPKRPAPAALAQSSAGARIRVCLPHTGMSDDEHKGFARLAVEFDRAMLRTRCCCSRAGRRQM